MLLQLSETWKSLGQSLIQTWENCENLRKHHTLNIEAVSFANSFSVVFSILKPIVILLPPLNYLLIRIVPKIVCCVPTLAVVRFQAKCETNVIKYDFIEDYLVAFIVV